ncbi:MAG: protein translocase subunit SecF [Deltaproteobacteria bacterium]|nr:protein translocase subunit SecF [Deltaproteobacteria bacterium]
MELIPHNINVDFVGKRLFFVLMSAGINLLSIILLLTWGFNYGVDFAGGTVVEARFQQPTTPEAIDQAVKTLALEDLSIQDLGRDNTTYLLRFKQGEQNVDIANTAVRTALATAFKETVEILRVEAVGAKVSGRLRQQGFLAVTFATLFMGLYITFRFEWRFGVGAVIALLHDVLVVTGVLILTQTPFDLTVLAAMLTVVGFSVHDTIIVSDRVRENLRKIRRTNLSEVINRSINETLSRTIITSGTALMVLIALYVIGGHVIRPFALTMIVGFITGTYSSIYIAAPVVLYFEQSLTSQRKVA